MDGTEGNRVTPGTSTPAVAPGQQKHPLTLHGDGHGPSRGDLLRLALAAQADAQGDVVIECDAEARLTGWASSGIAALCDGPLPVGVRACDALPAPLGAEIAALLAAAAGARSVAVDLSGRTEHFQISAIHLPGAQAHYVSLRPVTALRRLETRLMRRDALLKDLFDLAPVGIMLLNYKSGEVLEINEALMRFGKWSRSEVVGRRFELLLPDDPWSDVEGCIADLKQTGQSGPFEKVFRRPDGSLFEAIVRCLKVGAKGNRRVWVMIEDVSRSRAHLRELRMVRDEALRRRAELQMAVETLPHGFSMFDAEDQLVLINGRMTEIYPELAPMMTVGRRFEEILRFGVSIGLFPAASGREDAFIAEHLASREEDYAERLIETASGRLVRAIERRMPDGGRVGLRIDVTDEFAIQRHLSQVIEGARVGTWELDVARLEMRVNDRWAQILGLRHADINPISGAALNALVHPEDRDMTDNALCSVMARARDTVDMVFRMRHADGHWVWLESRGKVSRRDAAGQVLTLAGVHSDVSAMKQAELRLAGIIHGAEAGIWELDKRLDLIRVNDRWAEMLGYTAEELPQITLAQWTAMLHPEDLAQILAREAAIFAKGVWIYSYELRVRHKLGHWVWVQSRGRVTDWDATGKPVAMSGVHLDISARKHLETALKEERDFLATLMETSVSGIMAVDAEGRIIFVNREVEAIFELPTALLMGQICDPVLFGILDVVGQTMAFEQMPCRIALRTGQMQRDTRLRLAMADGREKVLSVNAALLPEQQGRLGVICTITDVTKAAGAEAQLREATQRAEATSEAKSRFLASVSHELRTPLNGILGMSELMLAERPDDDRQGMVRTIRESGAHLLSIVNDILDLAKVESGKLALETGPLALPELAARVDAMHRVTAMAKGVQLEVRLQDGLAAVRIGDTKRVLQVLHNLVGNAIKFTPEGKVCLCFAAKGGEQVEIRVTDSGIGMSPEQSATVWEEFTQADGSITRRFGGTGLGLPIVRRLVDLMGGEITLDSTEGVGTEVALILPLPLAPPAVLASGCNGPPKPKGLPQFAGLRALVADDNATNRVIMRAMLTRMGVEVRMVEDGDEVAQICAADAPDLILLDISMPRKDGVSALHEVMSEAKAQGRTAPPAIAVTANAMTHHVDDYLRAGFSAVVSKPVNLDALAEVIAKLCPDRVSILDEASGSQGPRFTPAEQSGPCRTG